MEVKLFGFTLLKTNEEKKQLTSFVPAESTNDDGLTVSSNFYSTSLNMESTAKSDAELINRYRDMSIYPEVEIAIDDIVSEAIVTESDKSPVRLGTKNLDLSDAVKNKIVEEFDNVLVLLNFNRMGYDIFKSWYVDGKLFYHIIIDESKPKDGIKELRKIDPRLIKKVKQVEKGTDKNKNVLVKNVKEYYLYNEKGLGTAEKQTGIPISKDSISHVSSGLRDSRKQHSIGHLHKAIKALNQLKMVEDSVVIYRWTRAPERRVFYIDVGNLPKLKAEQYIGDIMNKYKNKVAYDASTGEVKDDRRHMSMLEDFWFPRREGGRGTEIETLPGGSNLGEMDDVIYFQKKLYKSLNVPISRLEQDAGMQLGRATEISRDEMKFNKFIIRLRNQFNDLFYDLLKKQLILKGIISIDDWDDISQKLIFDFTQDSYYAEIKNSEMISFRIDLLSNMTDYVGKYYSNKWIMTNLLKFTEDEVNAMKKEITAEKKDPIFKPDEDEDGGEFGR